MTIEINHEETKDEQVHLLFSPVVESIIVLCAFLLQNKKTFQYIDLGRIEENLLETTKEFITKWQGNVTLDLLGCLELLLTVPQFKDVKAFCEGVSSLSYIEFAQSFLGGEIPLDVLETLITSPEMIDEAEPRYEWSTPENKHFIQFFLTEAKALQKSFSDALLDISRTEGFLTWISSNQPVAGQSLAEISKLNMKPLALAQYVMGKTFRRTSDYKLYYFIPSYGFSPSKMRVFNSVVCIVIYGCAKPVSDDREKSEELSRLLKVLSDPNRLLILRMLCGKKEYGARLAEYVGLTTATVSHHLDLLKKAKLIREEKIGAIKYFYADPVQLDKLNTLLRDFTKTE